MIREIRKKLLILNNRAPFKEETKTYINHMERVDWIYMNMKLDGSPLKRDHIEAILDGKVVREGRVMDHVLVDELDHMRRQIYGEERMSFLDKEWRKITPPIQEYGYHPPLPSQLPKLFDELGDFISEKKDIENPFEKAAEIHNRFIVMWPFREKNPFVARALMEYYLVKEGFPMVFLDMAEEKYNDDIIRYIKTKSSKNLEEYITKATLDRLELLIQLTAFY